MTESIKL